MSVKAEKTLSRLSARVLSYLLILTNTYRLLQNKLPLLNHVIFFSSIIVFYKIYIDSIMYFFQILEEQTYRKCRKNEKYYFIAYCTHVNNSTRVSKN